MSKQLTIEQISNIVAPIAKKYGIERVYLFGSYARNEADAASDIDLRVDRGKAQGLSFISFAEEIEAALQIETDVLSTGMLSEEFLNSIRDEEILIYGS